MTDTDQRDLPSILVVDDDPSIRESLRIALRREYRVETAAGARQALERLAADPPDALLLDVLMPELDGIQLLDRVRATDTDLAVVMITAVTSIKTVVEAMRRGADDYLTKPFDLEEVKLVLEKALERRALRDEVKRLRSKLSERFRFDRLVGRSKAMRSIYETIEQVRERKATVLIRGESGTGKELVAHAIHHTGPRKDKPCMVVNCAAIPETLLESELFGHERGAFTDARERKVGQFEAADGGTIFLDEIGELTPAMQAKILRVLQEREFVRVGGTAPIKVDVRVIAATNCDLESAVETGHFRRDLYYRINVVPILLPPLRERKEDIPFLIEHFLEKHAEERRRLKISPPVLDSLQAYEWPGNVRELENTVERMAALCRSDLIGPEDVPSNIREGGTFERLRCDVLAGRVDFSHAVESFEKELLREALARASGVQTRAAEVLGISRRILKYKMDKYGL